MKISNFGRVPFIILLTEDVALGVDARLLLCLFVGFEFTAAVVCL
jgi:hypothetical protein